MPCLKVLFSRGRHSQQIWLHSCVQGMGNSVSDVKLMPLPSCRVSKARADVVYSSDLSGSQASWESISSSLIPLSSVGKSWLKCAHNKPGLQDARNMTCHLSCPQFSTSLLLVMVVPISVRSYFLFLLLQISSKSKTCSQLLTSLPWGSLQ